MDEWVVEFSDEFDVEFEQLSEDVKSSLIQHLNLLKIYGPQLSRPYVEFEQLSEDVKSSLIQHLNLLKIYGPQLSRPYADTLNGSIYPNMKELRFNAADGAWRVAFAFDPQRQAIILVAGDKAGQNQRKFYRQLIDSADRRYTAHLDRLKE